MAPNKYAYLDKCLSYVGYCEKVSNKDLDSFTANKGNKNYTFFGRDYGLNPAQWCAIFVSMCMQYCTGSKAAAKEALCGGYAAGTVTMSDSFKKAGRYYKAGRYGKNPDVQPGDLIFFYVKSKGRIGHVGVVYQVDDSKVYTVEGNSSNAVRKHSYSRSNTSIDGYARPLYEAAPGPVVSGVNGARVRVDTSLNIRKGPGVSYKILGVAKNAALYERLGQTGTWYKINYNGGVAYISSKYADEEQARTVARVQVNTSLNIRSKPSTSGKILGTASNGALYEIKGEDGNWYKINYNGGTAYISKTYAKQV